MNEIVLGCGFGDEGKGRFVDYLTLKNDYSMVCRFNGGGQAGHTVVMRDGRRHVFSHFGSGSFRGLPTYWSNFCPISPKALLNEHDALKRNNVFPTLYIDGLCPVITPYDIMSNRASENLNRHGSCGMGFAATMRRHLTTPYKIHAQDLKYPHILKLKLLSLKNYYHLRITDEDESNFLSFCAEVADTFHFVNEVEFFKEEKQSHIIFEGAQGILLDMDFGFFPHVTYSNTTSKNALELIKRNSLRRANINYLTRAYQTRHGAGPMTNQNLELNVKNNFRETNVYNQWQGEFRKSVLDLDLLRYSIECDDNYSSGLRKNLVVSCLDQIEGHIRYTEGGSLKTCDSAKSIARDVCVDHLYESFSDTN